MSSLIITTQVPLCPTCAAAIERSPPILRHRLERGQGAAEMVVNSPGPGEHGPRYDLIERKAAQVELLLGLLKILSLPDGVPNLDFWRARAERAIADAEALLAEDPVDP